MTTGLTGGASRRLAHFFGLLTALVASFTAGAWVLDLDLLQLGPVYMFTPMAAAVVVCRGHGIPLRSIGLRRGRLKWLTAAALVWPPLALVVTAAALAVPGVSFDAAVVASETGVPAEPLWLAVGLVAIILVMILVGVTFNAVLALGEEVGWRGYLLWELAPLGFWRASAAIGAVWGVWHAPLVVAGLNYPSFPLFGILVFTVVCVVMSPLYTYLVVRADSVLAAVFLHGVFNATGIVGLAATDDAVLRELVASEGGVVGLVVFALVLVAIHTAGPPDLHGWAATGSDEHTPAPADPYGVHAD